MLRATHKRNFLSFLATLAILGCDSDLKVQTNNANIDCDRIQSVRPLTDQEMSRCGLLAPEKATDVVIIEKADELRNDIKNEISRNLPHEVSAASEVVFAFPQNLPVLNYGG